MLSFARLTRAIAALAVFAGCSQPPERCPQIGLQTSAIRLEAPASELEQIPADSTLAALYADFGNPEETGVVCTATRIADGVYITARHCIEEDTLRLGWLISTRAKVASDPCDEGGPQLTPVSRVIRHPHVDLAIVHAPELEGGGQQPETQMPPTMLLSKRPPELDSEVYIAGFGLTEHGSIGALRGLSARIVKSRYGQLTVQGDGGGACVGDSGGPLYTLDGSTPTLLGVLSTGSATCLGRDNYIEVSAVRPWITDMAGLTPPVD